MNGIIGMLDIALERHLTPEQIEELQTAQRCAYSLLSLLNDILDLSKIEAGKMTLEKMPFDVRSRGRIASRRISPRPRATRFRACAGSGAGSSRRRLSAIRCASARSSPIWSAMP